MDRNISREISLIRPYVALRKESVDRNGKFVLQSPAKEASLSARRAWIEIYLADDLTTYSVVALRKESVDRNSTFPGS